MLALATISFTLPESTRFEAGTVDSYVVDCDRGGAPLKEFGASGLFSARLYAYYVTGGGYQLIAEHSAIGREGLRDSFPEFDPGPGAWVKIAATADSGRVEGCTKEIFKPGYITAVEESEGSDPIISRRLFNVRGELVADKAAAGVYFERAIHRSGRIENYVVLKAWGRTVRLRR